MSTAKVTLKSDGSNTQNFKGGIGSLFDPNVNAIGRPYWPSPMEVSYFTFRFGAISQRDLCILSLPCDSRRITYIYAWFKSTQEKQLTLNWQNCLAGLNYEKIWRYNNSPPYVTARWPQQQIPPLNFLSPTAKNPVLDRLNDGALYDILTGR